MNARKVRSSSRIGLDGVVVRSLVTGAAILVFGFSCRKRPQEEAPPPAPVATAPAAEGSSDADESGGPKGWVPAEFKSGASRWKDVGVYVDGRPMGIISFGELPIALKPVWVDDEVSAPKRPGSNDPGYRIVKQRHYRFTDYLAALGVNLKKVKEVHVYGPKQTNSIVVSGEELRSEGENFLFRFGGEIQGKPIPVVPDDFGNGKSPDKISGVMVYIDKKPPKLVRNEGMVLDGELVTGVPYYGEPLRGGVRIYHDDRLAAVIKRKILDEGKLHEGDESGGKKWKFMSFLESQGVDTRKIVEAWVIREDRRKEKLTRAELEAATFEADPQAKGLVFLGEAKVPANVIALHSKPVRPEQLPQILPDEDIN